MSLKVAATWLARAGLLLLGGLLIGGPQVATASVADQAAPFSFQWTGSPPAPQPWQPKDWDLIVHARDARTWTQLDPLEAMHGADCSAPPATHLVTRYDDAAFICRNHMMTAFFPGGYGEIEFGPSQLADWSGGRKEIVSWHQSTFRTSARDWTDLLITPFDENLVLPNGTGPDLKGRPKDAIHIEMCVCPPTTWDAFVVNNFQVTEITTNKDDTVESRIAESAVVRSHYQLEITSTHIRFGIPELGLYWVDRDIPALNFTRGVVQFGHHSYTPDKECTPKPGVLSCTGDTWHWSDFFMSSSVPFTMLRGQLAASQYVGPDTPTTVSFPAAAPANSHLRFAAVGRISVSADGGATWTRVNPQPSELNPTGAWDDGGFYSYWVPVPAGTSAVKFRGEKTYWSDWRVVDPAIWSPAQPPMDVAGSAPAPSAAAPTAPAASAPSPAPIAIRPRLMTPFTSVLVGFWYYGVILLAAFLAVGAGVGLITWRRRRRQGHT